MTTLYFIENRFASRSQNGFTLVELIVTILLVGLIGVFTTLFVYTGLNGYLRARDTSEGALKAQIALDRISMELRDIDSIGVFTAGSQIDYTSRTLSGNRQILYSNGVLSINAGNCGRVGTTYMGVVGNPMNWNNVIIAENEEDSPWRPYHVRKGFKPSDSVVTLCEGWGVLSAKNSRYSVWEKEMDFSGTLKKIVADQDMLFGTIAVVSPPVANYMKQEGFDTVEKLTQFVAAPAGGKAPPPKAKIVPPPGQAKLPRGEMPFFMGPPITIVVTGGSNNNYWSYGGMACRQSVSIDEWR